ncbi:MAG: thiamine pyrophosphate-binding protein [Hyphomicrobiales bacterium]|nr:thiamine pyrophosphate-binding protein [Hyphomicrobiales bacterium]
MTAPSLRPAADGDRSVADSIARTLSAYGVQWAFGIPGNDVLELVRACEAVGITFVLAKSEPSAAFMADAVYQTTGRPAVLIAAMGPGLANAISGIAGALMERSALLVLAGEVATRQLGIYNHQVFDHVDLALPVTKFADRLNPDRAAQQTARALDVAMAHPAGAVLLNVPADLGRAPTTAEPAFAPAVVAKACLAEDDARAAAALLAAAERPLALVGRGALQDGMRAPLQAFLESWNIPFFASYKAKGLVDENHPLCVGAVGLSPVIDGENMKLVDGADLIVTVGYDPIELRDAWIDAWPHDRPCLTVDSYPQTHRVFPAGTQAIGDMAAILGQLAGRAPGGRAVALSDQARALTGRVAEIVRPRAPQGAISPAALFQTVSDAATPDWWMTVDVGAHRILANHAIRCQSPGQLVQSNGLCCMGYAVPAAIGAQLAHPDRTVVALLGDGCMLMSLGELGVAMERDLPLVVVVLNDSALALIKLKQSKMNMERRAVDFGAPRFDLIAQGFNAHGVRVDTIADFKAALDEAVAARRLTVIDAQVDPSEYWEQM